MIPLTLPWFVFFYLAIGIAGVLTLWAGYELLRRRQARDSARSRVFCRICGSRYRDTSLDNPPTCPVCGSKNER